MKRTIVVSLASSLIGFGLLLLLLSAVGSVDAQDVDVRSVGVPPSDVSAAIPLTATFTYQLGL